MSDDLRFAHLFWLVNLRMMLSFQVLKKLWKEWKNINEIQEKAYQFVKNIVWKHKNFNRFYSSKQSFNSLFIEIFIGFTMLVLPMSSWQKALGQHNKSK